MSGWPPNTVEFLLRTVVRLRSSYEFNEELWDDLDREVHGLLIEFEPRLRALHNRMEGRDTDDH